MSVIYFYKNGISFTLLITDLTYTFLNISIPFILEREHHYNMLDI